MEKAILRTQRELEGMACDDARASARMLGCALLLPFVLFVLALVSMTIAFILD